MPVNTWREGTEKMELGSFPWCQWQYNRQQTETEIQERFSLNTRKYFVTAQMTEHWHRLPRSCGVSSLEIFKSCPGIDLSTLLWVALLKPVLSQVYPDVPTNLSHALILWFLKKKAERTETLHPKEEKGQRDIIHAYKYPIGKFEIMESGLSQLHSLAFQEAVGISWKAGNST